MMDNDKIRIISICHLIFSVLIHLNSGQNQQQQSSNSTTSPRRLTRPVISLDRASHQQDYARYKELTDYRRRVNAESPNQNLKQQPQLFSFENQMVLGVNRQEQSPFSTVLQTFISRANPPLSSSSASRATATTDNSQQPINYNHNKRDGGQRSFFSSERNPQNLNMLNPYQSQFFPSSKPLRSPFPSINQIPQAPFLPQPQPFAGPRRFDGNSREVPGIQPYPLTTAPKDMFPPYNSSDSRLKARRAQVVGSATIDRPSAAQIQYYNNNRRRSTPVLQYPATVDSNSGRRGRKTAATAGGGSSIENSNPSPSLQNPLSLTSYSVDINMPGNAKDLLIRVKTDLDSRRQQEQLLTLMNRGIRELPTTGSFLQILPQGSSTGSSAAVAPPKALPLSNDDLEGNVDTLNSLNGGAFMSSNNDNVYYVPTKRNRSKRRRRRPTPSQQKTLISPSSLSQEYQIEREFKEFLNQIIQDEDRIPTAASDVLYLNGQQHQRRSSENSILEYKPPLRLRAYQRTDIKPQVIPKNKNKNPAANEPVEMDPQSKQVRSYAWEAAAEIGKTTLGVYHLMPIRIFNATRTRLSTTGGGQSESKILWKLDVAFAESSCKKHEVDYFDFNRIRRCGQASDSKYSQCNVYVWTLTNNDNENKGDDAGDNEETNEAEDVKISNDTCIYIQPEDLHQSMPPPNHHDNAIK